MLMDISHMYIHFAQIKLVPSRACPVVYKSASPTKLYGQFISNDAERQREKAGRGLLIFEKPVYGWSLL